MLNPRLGLRQMQNDTEEWTPLPEALNLALAREFAQPAFWGDMDEFYQEAGLPQPAPPILKGPFEAYEKERSKAWDDRGALRR